MSNKYEYARLYDFCVKDDYKEPGRGVIKRKERVAVGIFAYILLVVYILLYLLNVYRSIPLLVIICLTSLGFLYETRMGFLSYYNYKVIKRLNVKLSLNILECFCLYHNRDGNYINIQDKQIYKIKHHPFNWTIVKIFFRDEYKNKYVFRLSLKSVHINVCLSKVCNEMYIKGLEKTIETRYKYDIDNLSKIKSVNEFMMFIRDEYREIRERISS